jgi:hypothetical protein
MRSYRRMRIQAVSASLVILGATALGSVGPNAGAAPSSAPLKVALTLTKQRVVAGRPIKGTVVLTNTTKKEITVNTCAADGWLITGLSGHGSSYPRYRSAVACPPSVRLVPGTNRFPVTILTTYPTCSTTGSSTVRETICTAAGAPPPLPAGRYSAGVSLYGLDGLTRAPHRVVVTLQRPARYPALEPCALTPGAVPKVVATPNVVGESSFVAAVTLARSCLNVSYVDPVGGSVVAQNPAADADVVEHSTVSLTTR